MIVPLSASLRIVSSKHGWALQRSRRRKSETVWEAFKYYGTLPQALVAAGEREIRLSDGRSLTEAVEAYTRVIHRYGEILAGLLREIRERAEKIERRTA